MDDVFVIYSITITVLSFFPYLVYSAVMSKVLLVDKKKKKRSFAGIIFDSNKAS